MILLLSALLPTAHAACGLTQATPLRGALVTAPTELSVVATSDCTNVTFSVQGDAGLTPTVTSVTGPARRLALTPTAAQWTTWTAPWYPRLTWTITATDRSGATVTQTNVYRLDLDADGWARGQGDFADCDADASRNPGVAEACDGVDNDCDGAVDEAGATGSTLWFQDADGDGYGDPDASALTCAAPAGWVGNGDDCDDTAGEVYPDAPEVCDDRDDDCDALVDADDPDLLDGTAVYTDADDDGYGAGAAYEVCGGAAVGESAVAGDCDDGSAAVQPGATEQCDGFDNDCDALVDAADPDAAATAWYRDADGDGFGNTLVAESCDAPPATVANAGDCDDADAAVYPGALEVCDGLDDDCDGDASDAGLVSVGGNNYGTIAAAVAAASPGATVAICQGTYAESVTLTEDVTLEGVQGAAVTILDGEGSHGILAASGSTSAPSGSITLRGLTFTGALRSGWGAAVDARGASGLTVEDCVFTDNNAYYGGAVSVPTATGATTTISGSEFSGNSALFGGALDVDSAMISAEPVVVRATVFRGNTASQQGGAVGSSSTVAPLRFEGVTFEDNVASTVGTSAGGAISAFGPSLDLVDSAFSGNSAWYGGAIYGLNEGSLTLDGVNATSNEASDNGGVVTWWGDIVVTDSVMDDNTAPTGGVLYIQTTGAESLDIAGSTFSGNEATGSRSGGVLFTNGTLASLSIDSSDFLMNHAYAAGAVASVIAPDIAITASTFEANTSDGCGGGCADYTFSAGSYGSVRLFLSDVQFVGNTGGLGVRSPSSMARDYAVTDVTFRGHSSRGPVLYLGRSDGGTTAATATLDRVTIADNTTQSAPVSVEYVDVDCTDCDIYGNTGIWGGVYSYGGSWSGGAVHDNIGTAAAGGMEAFDLDSVIIYGNHGAYCGGASVGGTVRNIEVYDNTSDNWGGGLCAGGTLEDSSIHDNVAATLGGGIYTDGYLQINRTTIDGNSATDGGGVYHPAAWLYLTDSTVANNVASGRGGGTYGLLRTTGVAFEGNSAAQGGAAYLVHSSAYASYLTSTTLIANTASTSGDDLFLENPGGLYAYGTTGSVYLDGSGETCAISDRTYWGSSYTCPH